MHVKIRRCGMQERTLPPSWAGYTAPWHHQRGPTCLTVHTVSRLCVPVFSVSDHIRESAPECFATPRRRRLDPRTTDRGHLSTAASDVGAIALFLLFYTRTAPPHKYGGTVGACVGLVTPSCHLADRRGCLSVVVRRIGAPPKTFAPTGYNILCRPLR